MTKNKTIIHIGIDEETGEEVIVGSNSLKDAPPQIGDEYQVKGENYILVQIGKQKDFQWTQKDNND